MSSKNKSPWVTFNGEEIADSQIIIERLTKELDLSKTTEELSPEQTTLVMKLLSTLIDHRNK